MVTRVARLGERLGADVEDGKAGEVEGAADFAKEGRFFAVAFDQGELKPGRPILDGQAGESGAAAEIEERFCWIPGKRAGGRQRATRQSGGDHLFGRAQGGEVHALVPAGEQLEMDDDGGEQSVVELGGRDEGRKQIAQGGGFHGEEDKRFGIDEQIWNLARRRCDGAHPARAIWTGMRYGS